MGYIFVYTNSDHKGLTGIGYAEDWEKELKKLNKDPNNLGIISCDSVYEVNDKTDYDRFIKIVLSFLPDSRIKKAGSKKTDYFQVSTKQARSALENFAAQRNIGSVTVHPLVSETKNKPKGHRGRPTKKIVVEAPSPSEGHKRGPVLDYLLANNCISDKKNCNFASRNSKPPFDYWANPQFTCLDSDWTLILDDTVLKKFYIFKVPAFSIKKDELRPKRGYPNKIEITINYDDPTYTDSTSGYSFVRYKVKEVDYSSNDINSSNPENFSSDDVDEGISISEPTTNTGVRVTSGTKKYNDNAIHVDTRSTLSDVGDLRYLEPYKFELLGKEYSNGIKYWRDVLGKTLEVLYDTYPLIIEYLAANNSAPKKSCRTVFITKDESLIARDHRKLANADIYYLVNISAKATMDFLKFLLKRCGISFSDLVLYYH